MSVTLLSVIMILWCHIKPHLLCISLHFFRTSAIFAPDDMCFKKILQSQSFSNIWAQCTILMMSRKYSSKHHATPRRYLKLLTTHSNCLHRFILAESGISFPCLFLPDAQSQSWNGKRSKMPKLNIFLIYYENPNDKIMVGKGAHVGWTSLDMKCTVLSASYAWALFMLNTLTSWSLSASTWRRLGWGTWKATRKGTSNFLFMYFSSPRF